MASHSSPRNWLELPVDVCASIIRRLGVEDILTSVQFVCTTWRRICRDPSMWRSIHFDRRGIYYSVLFKIAVDLSSGGLLDTSLEFAKASDGLLRYITDRSKHLKRLRLVYSDTIHDEELIEAAGKIPFLEELDLSYCESISSQGVAAVGQLCPLLKTFKLNVTGRPLSDINSDHEAFAIAKNMSGLHHLQIFGNILTNDGLIAILDSCQQLESLDLRQCFHINMDADLKRRCLEQIKHFRGPHDSTHDYPFSCKLDYGRADFDWNEWSSRSDVDFSSDDEDLWLYR